MTGIVDQTRQDDRMRHHKGKPLQSVPLIEPNKTGNGLKVRIDVTIGSVMATKSTSGTFQPGARAAALLHKGEPVRDEFIDICEYHACTVIRATNSRALIRVALTGEDRWVDRCNVAPAHRFDANELR